MVGIENLEPQSNRNSRLLFGEQANWSDESVGSTTGGREAAVWSAPPTPAKTGGDLYKYLAKITSLGLNQVADATYPLDDLSGYDDQSHYLPPALSAGGTVEIIMTHEGTAPWLAMLGDTVRPTETAITNTGGVSTSSVSLTSATAVSVGVTAAPNGVKLEFSPSGATLNSGIPNGGLILRGVDADSNPIMETITWLEDDLTEDKISKNFYATGSLTAQPFGFSAGTVSVSVDANGGTTVRFNPESGVVRRFITCEASNGDVPHKFFGLCINNGTFSLDRSSKLMLSADFIGRKAQMYSSFSDTTDNVDNPTRTPLPASIVESNENAFVGWQGVGYYGGIKIPMRSFSFGVNRNLVFTDGMGGDQYQVSPPVGDGKREVPLTLELIYDKRNNWDQFFKCADDFTDLVIDVIPSGCGDFPAKVRFVAKRAQMIAPPTLTNTGTGPIYQTANFMCVRRPGDTGAFYLEATYQDYDRVRQYDPRS